MVSFGELARVTTRESREVDDDHQDAWELWTSVTGEALRTKCKLTEDGFYVYRGTFRKHVDKLWGHLPKDDRLEYERRLYAFLKANGLARCVHRKSPTIWHVAATWRIDQPVIVRTFKMSQAEKRVTAEEAGEHLPPGEVTVATTKETENVTRQRQASMDALKSIQERRAAAQDARREKILDFLVKSDQPLTCPEVAHGLQIEVSTIRKDMNYLVENELIYTRTESLEERLLRFGGQTRATRAALYSTEKPVPERTVRSAVDGYVAELPVTRKTRPGKGNPILWAYLSSLSSSNRFSVNQISERTGLGKEFIRRRVNDMLEANLIKQSGFMNTSRAFTIGNNRPAIRKMLNISEDQDAQVTQAKAVREPQAATPAPAVAGDINELITEVVDRNEQLENQVAELEAENKALRTENDRLSAQVEQLTQPAADPALVDRLRRAAGRA